MKFPFNILIFYLLLTIFKPISFGFKLLNLLKETKVLNHQTNDGIQNELNPHKFNHHFLHNRNRPESTTKTAKSPKFATSLRIGKKAETSTKKNIQISPIESAMDYLYQNGYTLGIEARNNLVSNTVSNISERQEFKDTISLFQRLNNLNVTGKLDHMTETIMKNPRCGVADLNNEFMENSNTSNQPIVLDYALKPGWNKTHLNYKFLRFNEDLKEDGTRKAIERAFNYWSINSKLTFQEVCRNCESDLIIDFAYGPHGDSFPFDGPGMKLAHAFPPTSGKIHFDESENFTEGTHEGINLRLVATHEIGHALGLGHSHILESVMYPYYVVGDHDENFKLSMDDILGIQTLYGRNEDDEVIDSTAYSNNYKPSSNSQVPPCNTSIDAIFTTPQNDILVIVKHDELWQFNATTKLWNTINLYGLLPKIEFGIRGGVKCNNNYTWFFKGRYVWAFKGYHLLNNFPRYITDPLYPNNPYTAIIKNGEFYILKGSFAYLFDTTNLKIIGNHPEYVRSIFPGAPDWIGSSLRYNGHLLMFKDNYGSPESKINGWFPCL